MRWVNVLHFYQPPLSRPEIVAEAVRLSYRRVTKALLKSPNSRVTVNFAGCLLEQLLLLNQHELIADWQRLVASGQVELTGSAYWHALLPKISGEELASQVAAQEKILARLFKIARPAGFFAPELAYSPELIQWLAQRGYHYAIVDEISIDGRLDTPKQMFYRDQVSGLVLVVRQRDWSKKYPPEILTQGVDHCPQNLFTVTDGELYGLRHRDYSGKLERCWRNPKIKTETVSQAIASQDNLTAISLVAASWESWPDEIAAKQPFAVWDSRANHLQKMLWSLADLAQQAAQRFTGDSNQKWVARHLHQGLSSCAWWWASGRDFALFGSAAWGPEEIIRGAEQLVKSVRSIDNPASRPWKQQADKIFCSLQTRIWQKHWQQWKR
ncbi:MAG TPA: hypothetical protein PLX67_00155 [bacterium]|nr:hypothetical protein [bacterium]